MLNRSASLAMSTSVLKALPGKLDIKRHSPSILYLYVFLVWVGVALSVNVSGFTLLLSCQPKVTVTPCFVYKVIRDLSAIDHLCINPILWIGLIHK